MIEQHEYQPGDTLDGKWTIASVLEQGPVSRCYFCQDNFSRQRALLKIYHRSITESYFSNPNFLMQAGVGTAIRHDNLPAMLEVKKDGEYFLVVREHIDGVNFDTWLQNPENAIQTSRALELLWQACQGLVKIHETGKHLNIHPGNILVSNLITYLTDPDPRALSSSELPRFLPMSPFYLAYRAPEILEDGGTADTAADLYSMAALSYRAVFNVTPPAEYEEISRVVENVQPEARDFFKRALHPNPFGRFRNAEDFADALWALSGSFQAPSSVRPEIPSTVVPIPSDVLFSDSPQQPAEPLPPSPEFPVPDASFAPESSEAQWGAAIPDDTSQSQFQEPPSAGLAPDPPAFEPLSPKPPLASKPTSPPFTGKALYQKGRPLTYPTLDGSESFTQFGFKGLSSGAPQADKSKEQRKQTRKKVLFAVLFLLAVAFIILAAAVIFKLVARDADQVQAEAEKALPAEALSIVPDSAPEMPDVISPTSEAETSQPVQAMLDKASPETEGDDNRLQDASPQSPPAEPQTEHWPPSPSACFTIANEFNDMGKTEEANRYYQHVLTYPGVTDKQKIQALGGSAVTFYNLGKEPEALNSLQQILELNPNNPFALSYLDKIHSSH